MSLPIARIALSGKMRSGKDTVADYLAEQHGFYRAAFADKLKEVAEDLFGMKGKNRALLQLFGLRMCQIDKVVWVRYVLGKIPLGQDVVISDLRFPAEYWILKAFGFLLVRIDITAEEQRRRLVSTELDASQDVVLNAGEVALDGDSWAWDYRIDGTIPKARLYEKVDMIIADIKAIAKADGK